MLRFLESRLSRFFKSPTEYFQEINVAPFPDAKFKNILGFQKLWFATTIIKEGNLKDAYSVIRWGGTGVHKFEKTAMIISVCEAMERWALVNYGLRNSSRYGFDLDPTSNGMAAFPLKPQKARENSRLEAMERYVFSQLAKRPYQIIKLKKLPRMVTDLISRTWEKDEIFSVYQVPTDTNAHFYLSLIRLGNGGAIAGFAAGDKGVTKSAIECIRHKFIYHSLKNVSSKNPVEQAILYWASPMRKSEIDGWTAERVSNRKVISVPLKPFIDEILPGPWEPDIYLWRTLFDNSLNYHTATGFLLY